jgi:hypothetical protein
MWAKEKELEEKVGKFSWSIFRIQFEKMLPCKEEKITMQFKGDD